MFEPSEPSESPEYARNRAAESYIGALTGIAGAVMKLLSIDAVNALDAAGFAARFGDVAEASPWVAEAAFEARPFFDREALVEAFVAAARAASPHEQLTLLRAHPDLAGRAAVAGDIAEESRREQAGAGLDRLTAEEFLRFDDLNARYRERFGFPFILAVKGATKDAVLAALEARIGNDAGAEYTTALANVERILRFRIEDRVAS